MDGFISVDQEAIYKGMNDPTLATQSEIFKNDHKSHYRNIDIETLDEHRTIPYVYLFGYKFKPSDLIEVEQTRA